MSNGFHGKTPKGWGCWTVPAVCALFFVILFIFLLMMDTGGGWIDLDFSIGGIWRDVKNDRRHSAEDRRLFDEIKGYEALGGPEASEALLNIAFSGPRIYSSRAEAFAALGRLGRLEDVPELIKHSDWYNQVAPKYMLNVAPVLGQIGGDEACRALSRKLLVDSERAAYDHTDAYGWQDFKIKLLIEAIREGQCLSNGEMNLRLQRFAFDPWVPQGLMTPALESLAENGNERAVRYLQKMENPPDTEAMSLDEFRNFLSDPSYPMFVRTEHSKKLIDRKESKVRLLDVLLESQVQWYKEAPGELIAWPGHVNWEYIGSGILYREFSAWEGLPESYFEDWIKKLPDQLPGLDEAAALMLKDVQGLERSHIRYRTNYENRMRLGKQ
jgi:hypothetical protein